MPNFGKSSQENLKQSHTDLQRLFNEVIKYYDCTVICGHRDKESQNKAVLEGKSKLKYPQSKHNSMPSMAVDVVPYPIDWNNLKRFYHFGGFVLGLAAQMGINIRWGGDWDKDYDITDEKFIDLPHFELVK